MGKKLAIKGHPTRSEEVIKLLEMMGGNDSNAFRCNNPNLIYYVLDNHTRWDYIGPEEIDEYNIFTLEEFLVKFPFKVGDVIKFPNDMAEEIDEMKWDEDLEDIIYTSVSGWTRPCYVNNKTNMEIDCKKCGLHFGSVRCFDKDCPHNAPKSYAVGLKDGKVIECGVNKEIVMNEIKPLFKAGDVVKLKGDPDENLFWIIMDVVKDGYIFNDGKKIPFDEQHHYEKTNREVMLTAPPEIATLNMSAIDYNNGLVGYEIPEGYEFDTVIDNKVVLKKLKPTYPKTYDECCEMLNADEFVEYELMVNFPKLINARNAYWKIVGEQMGLGKPWKPDWDNYNEYKYCLYISENNVNKGIFYNDNHILAFPTEEMRDVFYKNFKNEIEQCKELL